MEWWRAWTGNRDNVGDDAIKSHTQALLENVNIAVQEEMTNSLSLQILLFLVAFLPGPQEMTGLIST